MIRKLYVLWMVIFLFGISACQNSEWDETQTDHPIEKSTNIVTIEEAEQELLSILDDLAKQTTRSMDGNAKNLTISSRYSLGNYVQTRSMDEDSDHYIHIFNLGEEEGYAIMSGDDRVTPLLALSFNGSITPDTELDNPGVVMALARIDDMFEYRLKINEDLLADGAGGGGSSTSVKYSAWSNQYYSMKHGECRVKWGQRAPHNTYCFTSKGKPAFVGCVAVAVAQLMSCYQYPVSYNGYNYNWAQMTSSSFVSSIKDQTYRNQITRLLQQVGTSNNLSMSYGAIEDNKGSGAPSKNIPRTLKNFGYGNGGTLKDYNTNTLVSELKNGYYCLISGYAYKKKKKVLGITVNTWHEGGHQWLAEGLMRRYRTKTTYNSAGKKLSETTEESYYILCNFGWSGDRDGYYLSGDFDTNHPPAITRSSDEEDLKYGEEKNYQYKLDMITGIRK